ncbi:actin-binding Rho-activating protein isoform X1 [Lepisosteus oculatus]|uniref:actin-binding Rho-activating protein isoform X1 n=2 Tax=Lepisosteus oculatus TaxID=7918 RepID=UPI0035F52C92
MQVSQKQEMEKDDPNDHGNLGKEICVSTVEGLKLSWQRWSNDHSEYQKHNPFSTNRTLMVKIQKGEESYGRPKEGSKTEQRGKDAHTHIGKEVQELCSIIKSIGESREDGRTVVEFGKLFERYVTISNKVVGVLLRARRQGLVAFEGEMLWQGRDDFVLITLLH